MANVNADGIVTPDDANAVDPSIWSAAMADSISNGIGQRLAKQEIAIGCKAGIPEGTTVAYTADIIAPFQILPVGECFAQGMTLVGGIATVTVAGMYHFTAAASLEATGAAPSNVGRTIALQLRKNGIQLVGAEVEAKAYWSTSSVNTVVNCVPGDQLYVTWYSAGPVAGEGSGTLTPNTPMNSMSIVLVTPIAV